MQPSILIIEDEPTLSRLLAYNLQQEGYTTEVVEHGGDGFERAKEGNFDLIILDLMLPGMNGFEILRKLRENDVKTSVIILTARNAEEEVVQGLKLGADDYITKPFGVAEMLARVSAVLRRTGTYKDEDAEDRQENVLSIGDIHIYPDKYEVWLNGQSIALRPKEFEMLLYLAQRPGVVITRDDLMNKVWGFDYIGGQRTVDVHISTLRKKLEDSDSIKIDSIRGIGYKLVVI